MIFIIVAILIVASLGAAVATLFNTSSDSQARPNKVRRAYYLAESGLRYAFSEVRHGTSQETVVSTLNQYTTTLDSGRESFSLALRPYWFKITGTSATAGAGSTSITASVPASGLPDDFALASGTRLLAPFNDPITISSLTVTSPNSVTFQLASPCVIQNGVQVDGLLVLPTDTSQTVGNGTGSLRLSLSSLTGLPARNGQFNYQGAEYTYRSASLDATPKVVLDKVSWEGGSSMTFPSGADLVLRKNALVESTGAFTTNGQQTTVTRSDNVGLYGSDVVEDLPPSNYKVLETGFTGNDLSSLDLSQSGNIVRIGSYIATGGTHLYWASFTKLGDSSHRVHDPEEPSRYIGYHVTPLASETRDALYSIWQMYRQVNYDIQVKMGWYKDMQQAGSGISFRWHESPASPGLYQGYGISFIRYCSSCNDYIPNSIKPSGQAGQLMLLLWEQKVVSGVETKRWLAYALLGDPTNRWAARDPKVVGNQDSVDGYLNDDASILVRVGDKFASNGQRINTIRIYYSDASPYYPGRTYDGIATNINRRRYSPEWVDASLFPKWASNATDPLSTGDPAATYWDGQSNAYDYFTLLSPTPKLAASPVVLVKNPAATDVILQSDQATLTTQDFTLSSFPSSRPELGLHAMGNLNDSDRVVAFDDMSIQVIGESE